VDLRLINQTTSPILVGPHAEEQRASITPSNQNRFHHRRGSMGCGFSQSSNLDARGALGPLATTFFEARRLVSCEGSSASRQHQARRTFAVRFPAAAALVDGVLCSLSTAPPPQAFPGRPSSPGPSKFLRHH